MRTVHDNKWKIFQKKFTLFKLRQMQNSKLQIEIFIIVANINTRTIRK